MMMTMMTRMMRKKGDSYLCLAAWAEGEPRYWGVPFLSHQSSLSQMSTKLSSQNVKNHYFIRIVFRPASPSGQFSSKMSSIVTIIIIVITQFVDTHSDCPKMWIFLEDELIVTKELNRELLRLEYLDPVHQWFEHLVSKDLRNWRKIKLKVSFQVPHCCCCCTVFLESIFLDPTIGRN